MHTADGGTADTVTCTADATIGPDVDVAIAGIFVVHTANIGITDTVTCTAEATIGPDAEGAIAGSFVVHTASIGTTDTVACTADAIIGPDAVAGVGVFGVLAVRIACGVIVIWFKPSRWLRLAQTSTQ